MKEKLNKSQSASLLKKLIDVETNVNYEGDFVEMNVMGKLNQKKEQEINLKSIYELMITFKTEVNQKFESIDNRFDSIDTRLSSLESEIKTVKEDVKKLDTKVNTLDAKVTDLDNKVIALDAKVTTLDTTVQKLDTKVSKVIELNKDIINLNMLKVSKENKKWLFSNDGDDNTPTR